MGRGTGHDQQSSSLLYGEVARRADFAALLAGSDPKAFYVHFERQFKERLMELAERRLRETYPSPDYDLDIMLPGTGLPPESSFEELVDEQDDDFLVSCTVLTRDSDGNWGVDCSDGFYLTADELLDLGWHREGTGLADRCRAHLQEAVSPSDPTTDSADRGCQVA